MLGPRLNPLDGVFKTNFSMRFESNYVHTLMRTLYIRYPQTNAGDTLQLNSGVYRWT